ncbi:MAG TPA: class I tRNA ligase family protein, partial [Bacillota bacterium]|nr:class I tRNA ligase family protein [Bacillota bacterium]
GIVPTLEPYSKRTSHGLVLGEDNEKMSKSRGNVINPDEMVDRYGADSFRLFELFMGAFDQPIPWSTQGLVGMQRFLYRVWDLQYKVMPSKSDDLQDGDRIVHQTIRKVGEDIEEMKYNTALAQLMSLANWFGKQERIEPSHWDAFVKLMAPFAPHIAEELFEARGYKKGLAHEPWPVFDPEKAKEDEIEVPVQVNGKLKDVVKVAAGIDQDELLKAALASEKVASLIEGRTIKRTVVIPGKMVNIVIG